MRISRITDDQVALPPEHPYRPVGGRLKSEVPDARFIRPDTDDGLTGWGEGTRWGRTSMPAHGPAGTC